MMFAIVLIFSVIIISVVIIGIYKYVEPQQKNNANLMNEDNGKKTDNNKLLNPNEAMRKEIITLFNDFNILGELSLMEIAQKLDEISKLHDTDKLEKKLKDLRYKKYKLENKIRQDKKNQFRTNKQEVIFKDQFLVNTLLSIFIPFILFILFFEIATTASSSDWHNTHGIRSLVWGIYILLVSYCISFFHKARKRHLYYNNKTHKVIFNIALFATIFSLITSYIGIKLDWPLSEFLYLLGISFSLWMLYYFFIIGNIFFKTASKKIKDSKIEVKKNKSREKAITELKEAKDLFDLGILSKEEYDVLSQKLKPIILNN